MTGSRGSPGKVSEDVTRGLYAASIPVLPSETEKTRNSKEYLRILVQG
jgi:hypothetical protein